MAKGKVNIKFKDGSLDGHIIESFDSRSLTDELHQDTGSWLRREGDIVQAMSGGKLDNHWISYKIEVYKKANKDKNGYFEYKYDKSRMIERCSAITKAGSQCKHECYDDLDVCKTHR